MGLIIQTKRANHLNRKANYKLSKQSILFKYILFLLFLSTLFSVQGQNQVIDSESKLPISYAHLKLLNQSKGVISDFNGFFVLDSTFRKLDSLIISCIGYNKQTLLVRNILEKKVVELSPTTQHIPEVHVSAKKTKSQFRNLGMTKKPKKSNFPDYAGTALNGEEKAVWIPNEYSIPGDLKNIRVFVSDLGYPDAHFRIHVYDCEEFETKPGNELTTSNLIASASKGNEWVLVDVSSEHIQIGENGCFIGIEWFDSPQSIFHLDTVYHKAVTWDGERNKDTVYSRIRGGNGAVLGARNQKYRFSKNKPWYKTNDGWKKFNLSDSILYTQDTLPDGSTYLRTPDNCYQAVLCINIDVAFPKNKVDLVYEKPKKRKLNKLENVKENPFNYPQKSIQELVSSLIKAFENDDLIYVLKFLCVYKTGQLDELLSEILDEENENYLADEKKVEIVSHLKKLQLNLNEAVLTKIADNQFELVVNHETYTLIIEKGIWKINPYSHQLFE